MKKFLFWIAVVAIALLGCIWILSYGMRMASEGSRTAEQTAMDELRDSSLHPDWWVNPQTSGQSKDLWNKWDQLNASAQSLDVRSRYWDDLATRTFPFLIAAFGLILFLGAQILLKFVATKSAPDEVVGLLRAFYWFCSEEDRATIECIARHLQKDRAKMEKEGRGTIFIRAVVAWRALSLPKAIMFDGLSRIFSVVSPFKKL